MEGSGPLPMGDKLRQLKAGETLAAERGRAEVLLNPATVLRLGNMSRLRMDNVEVSDPCLTLLSGSAVISIYHLARGQMPKQDRVEVHTGGGIVVLSRPGEYRIDADGHAGLRVYEGRAGVSGAPDPLGAIDSLKVGRGKSVDFSSFEIAKFDTRSADSLERWAQASSRTPARGLRPIPPPLGLDAKIQQPQQPQQAQQQPGGFTNSAPIPPPHF